MWCTGVLTTAVQANASLRELRVCYNTLSGVAAPALANLAHQLTSLALVSVQLTVAQLIAVFHALNRRSQLTSLGTALFNTQGCDWLVWVT